MRRRPAHPKWTALAVTGLAGTVFEVARVGSALAILAFIVALGAFIAWGIGYVSRSRRPFMVRLALLAVAFAPTVIANQGGFYVRERSLRQNLGAYQQVADAALERLKRTGKYVVRVDEPMSGVRFAAARRDTHTGALSVQLADSAATGSRRGLVYWPGTQGKAERYGVLHLKLLSGDWYVYYH